MLIHKNVRRNRVECRFGAEYKGEHPVGFTLIFPRGTGFPPRDTRFFLEDFPSIYRIFSEEKIRQNRGRNPIPSLTVMPPHSCHRMYAAAFTQYLCRSIHAPRSRHSIVSPLMQLHWCCPSNAAAFMHHLARRSVFLSQHSRCRSHVTVFFGHFCCR